MYGYRLKPPLWVLGTRVEQVLHLSTAIVIGLPCDRISLP